MQADFALQPLLNKAGGDGYVEVVGVEITAAELRRLVEKLVKSDVAA